MVGFWLLHLVAVELGKLPKLSVLQIAMKKWEGWLHILTIMSTE